MNPDPASGFVVLASQFAFPLTPPELERSRRGGPALVEAGSHARAGSVTSQPASDATSDLRDSGLPSTPLGLGCRAFALSAAAPLQRRHHAGVRRSAAEEGRN